MFNHRYSTLMIYFSEIFRIRKLKKKKQFFNYFHLSIYCVLLKKKKIIFYFCRLFHINEVQKHIIFWFLAFFKFILS